VWVEEFCQHSVVYDVELFKLDKASNQQTFAAWPAFPNAWIKRAPSNFIFFFPAFRISIYSRDPINCCALAHIGAEIRHDLMPSKNDLLNTFPTLKSVTPHTMPCPHCEGGKAGTSMDD
jgi:hypothetical protein